MTTISITQNVRAVTVQQIGGPVIEMTVQSAPSIDVMATGMRGPAGTSPVPGPGFVLVGAELRFSISSLPQG